MDQSTQFRQILSDAIRDGTLVRAVFSRPKNRTAEFRRIDARPIKLRGQPFVQVARRTQTQEFHDNIPATDAFHALAELAGHDFRDVRLETTSVTCDAKFNRRGECSFTCRPTAVTATAVRSHDRPRSMLIPEGTPCPFLERIGVMDAAGHVRSKSQKKFRQINHYLRLIRDCVHPLPSDGPVHIVDFGCGKSYLTFATRHLFREILNRECHIVGLDRRADVVRHCSEVAASLGMTDVQFVVGDIASWIPEHPVQMAISLHACDTATDDALCQAVRWNADVILAVPCCQHELAELLATRGQTPELMPGVLQDRYCALTTDAMRAAVLRAVGYQADVIEFIDTEHTPKNLMIRAFRRRHDRQNPDADASWDALHRYRDRFDLPAVKLERMLAAPDAAGA